MKHFLSRSELIGIARKVCLDMEANRDELQLLDAKAGDGDLGVTVKLGFHAVGEFLSENAESEIGIAITQSGIVFNKAAASTFGTLTAIAMMRAGRLAKGRHEIRLADIVALLKGAIDGISERGGAVQGDCTMLDALIPAWKALQEGAENGMPLCDAFAKAAELADHGARITATMTKKHGRAAWISAKPTGEPDAGAMAVAMMLGSFSRHLNEICGAM